MTQQTRRWLNTARNDLKAARLLSCAALLLMIGERLGREAAPELETAARKLDLHYIQSRCPNGLGGDPSFFCDGAMARELVQCAERILEHFEPEMT